MTTSTGAPSLDQILGGGLPKGSITVVDEDANGVYSKTLCKLFLAEGVVSKHPLFVASLDVHPETIIKDLPALVNDDKSVEKERSKVADEMKIAFRYQHLPVLDKEDQKIPGHFYDLSKNMPIEQIQETDIAFWREDSFCDRSFTTSSYYNLLTAIKNRLASLSNKTSPLRIALHSLGSPMWSNSLIETKHINKFLFCLRALVKCSNAVAFITIPSYIHSQIPIQRCVHLSDIGMRLQSFAGTELEGNPALKDYHGFFYLLKVAPNKTFLSKHPGCTEFGFKMRRKKFSIEVLHLPPDFEESNEGASVGLGCFGQNKQLLEF